MLQIKIALPDEISWINTQYQEVNFAPSVFENEIIAIAEFNSIKAGLGRLVKIAPGVYELGGIYVLSEHRNHKIATSIIEFLLNQAGAKETIFCIPFESLSPFYQRFGFKKVTSLEIAPAVLIEKYTWCQKTYKDPVDLLIINH